VCNPPTTARSGKSQSSQSYTPLTASLDAHVLRVQRAHPVIVCAEVVVSSVHVRCSTASIDFSNTVSEPLQFATSGSQFSRADPL